jgi:hypothetical protein
VQSCPKEKEGNMKTKKTSDQPENLRQPSLKCICSGCEELQAEIAQLKGEEPMPYAWWAECPKLAQKTMERIIAENEKLKLMLTKLKQNDSFTEIWDNDEESIWDNL